MFVTSLLLGLALLATPSVVSALVIDQHIGAGFNVNRSQSNFPLQGYEEKLATSFNFALKAVVSTSDEWAVRTGLILQNKKAKYSYEGNGFRGDLLPHVIYVTVPVNLQYKVSNDLSVFGGYMADYKINHYCVTYGDFKSCPPMTDPKMITHVANIGMTIATKERWEIDLSYQHHLTDAYKDIKIHSVQGTVFYRFN